MHSEKRGPSVGADPVGGVLSKTHWRCQRSCDPSAARPCEFVRLALESAGCSTRLCAGETLKTDTDHMRPIFGELRLQAGENVPYERPVLLGWRDQLVGAVVRQRFAGGVIHEHVILTDHGPM